MSISEAAAASSEFTGMAFYPGFENHRGRDRVDGLFSLAPGDITAKPGFRFKAGEAFVLKFDGNPGDFRETYGKIAHVASHRPFAAIHVQWETEDGTGDLVCCKNAAQRVHVDRDGMAFEYAQRAWETYATIDDRDTDAAFSDVESGYLHDWYE